MSANLTQKDKTRLALLIAQLAIVSVVVLFVVKAGPSARRQRGESLRETEEYADALMNRELYAQAAQAYQEALQAPGLSRPERARLNHLLATIYLENLKDYPNALARFEKVKQLDPKSSLGRDAEKKIIQCLENLGRPLDAQVEMEESVALKPTKATMASGPVVAKIGNRDITLGEVDARLNQLPPALRSQFAKPQQKLKFVQEYIVTELLYDAAKRKGYDSNADVNRALAEAKKGLMVQKLLEDRVATKVAPTEAELRKYYDSHKQKYVVTKNGKSIGTKSFEVAKAEVQQDLLRDKGQAVYQQLIQEQLKAQDVKILSDRILPAGQQ